MAFVIFTFFCVFLVIAAIGMVMFNRGAMMKRMSGIMGNQQKEERSLVETLQQTGTSIGSVVEKFEKVVPKTQAEVGVVQQRLIRAGFRSDTAVSFFYGTKVLVILILCAVVFGTGVGGESPFIMYAAALGCGYLAPDFWLGRKIKTRQKKVRLGLPDVLDLLVICVEAGLGLDQATARTSQELMKAQPAISDELSIVALEQRAGRPREDAWRHMAERTDVDTVRNLVSMLVQSEQFGTSIAKTLRTHSETLRTQRIQQVEEMAAKTTVKLIFPLVLFIFPCLFLVVLGPAGILMAESFKEYLTH
jgi:tight adherence protein C